MKWLYRLATVCVFLCLALPLYAQTTGLAPAVRPTFFNASGTVAGLGFLCTTQSGSNTSLLTYQDNALTTANQNPIRLNAVGRAVNGSNEVSIFLQAKQYRFTIYAAGTGNTCNGTTVGTLLNQIDNVYDLASLFTQSFATVLDDQVCHASQETGTSPNDLSGKVAACITALPSTGGIVDARGLQGTQVASVDPFGGTSKKVTLILGQSTITSSTAWNPAAGSTIIGAGRGLTTIQTSGNNTNGINILGSSTIAHLSIVGTNVLTSGTGMGINSASASNVNVEDVDISAMSNHCLNTGGTPTNWNITNNYIHGCGNDGLLISNGATSSSMVANIMYNNGSNGIDLNGSGNLVTGNVIAGNGWRFAGTGIDNFGILVNGNGSAPATNADNNVITGNTVVANVGPGIFIRSDSPQHANGNIVSGNVCSNNSSTGVANGDGITIDTSSTGTESNNSVVGNTCLNNQRYGIQIGGGAGTATFNLISGNTASGNGTGNIGNSGTTSKVWGNNETTADANFYLDTGSIIVKANSPVLALGGNAAGAGAIRLYNNPSGGGISYRNAANSADLVADVIDNNNNHIIRGGGGPNSFVLQTSTGLALLTCNESQFCTFNAQATFALGLDVANGSSLPSAANFVLGNAGNYFNVTGTTQINCVDNTRVGPIYLRFAGALTFKHNQACTTGFQPMLNPGSVDITTNANTVISLIRDTSAAVWQVTAVKQP